MRRVSRLARPEQPAQSVERDGYRFDLGGHRFFTKNKEVNDLWLEIMGDEFLKRPRMSRIYWNNRYLDYPLKGTDVIKKLGPVELTRCMVSYLVAAAKPKGNEDSLEQWVTNRFGKRLFELFFKRAEPLILAYGGGELPDFPSAPDWNASTASTRFSSAWRRAGRHTP